MSVPDATIQSDYAPRWLHGTDQHKGWRNMLLYAIQHLFRCNLTYRIQFPPATIVVMDENESSRRLNPCSRAASCSALVEDVDFIDNTSGAKTAPPARCRNHEMDLIDHEIGDGPSR